jgi:diaminopimelate epimerase
MNTFVKYEGAGNDFILIDDRSLTFNANQVTRLCHRRFGVGADGVVLLQPSTTSDFRMRIFNSDGTEAESCGNALRCLGRFLTDLGFPEKQTSIETMHRSVFLSYSEGLIVVGMGEAKQTELNLSTEHGPVHYTDTGVPHAVRFVHDITNLPIHLLGPFFRHHTLFGPKGANANFASIQSDGIHVRTFERGVEGETLACGTGACAVASIASKVHKISGPIDIVFTGGRLRISFEGDQIFMAGPANRVFSGQIIDSSV